ncbi:hypothetical protein T484DRAFT_1969504 [Baffinella frigidus]|nr:hypothetical protein T484DRAFT_1969504 [Cryptophyta sp. CCMP2293]
MPLYESLSNVLATSLNPERASDKSGSKSPTQVDGSPGRHQPPAPRPPEVSGNWLDGAAAFFSGAIGKGPSRKAASLEDPASAAGTRTNSAVDAVQAKLATARTAALRAPQSGRAAHEHRKANQPARAASWNSSSSPAAGAASSPLLRSISQASSPASCLRAAGAAPSPSSLKRGVSFSSTTKQPNVDTSDSVSSTSTRPLPLSFSPSDFDLPSPSHRSAPRSPPAFSPSAPYSSGSLRSPSSAPGTPGASPGVFPRPSSSSSRVASLNVFSAPAPAATRSPGSRR